MSKPFLFAWCSVTDSDHCDYHCDKTGIKAVCQLPGLEINLPEIIGLQLVSTRILPFSTESMLMKLLKWHAYMSICTLESS